RPPAARAPAARGVRKNPRLADWDPPFAVDLSRVRPQDEAYWQQYRTTPKAWLPMPFGQRLWGHRLGQTTSLRLTRLDGAKAAADPAAAFSRDLVAHLDPGSRGLSASDVRTRALEAARGAT